MAFYTLKILVVQQYKKYKTLKKNRSSCGSFRIDHYFSFPLFTRYILNCQTFQSLFYLKKYTTLRRFRRFGAPST